MYRDFGVNPVNLTKPREVKGTWHGKDFRLAKVWISEPRLSRSDRAGSRGGVNPGRARCGRPVLCRAERAGHVHRRHGIDHDRGPGFEHSGAR